MEEEELWRREWHGKAKPTQLESSRLDVRTSPKERKSLSPSSPSSSVLLARVLHLDYHWKREGVG